MKNSPGPENRMFSRHTVAISGSTLAAPAFSLIAFLSLAACGPTTSVEPPELNPHPAQGVTLYVSAPESLKVRVGASYGVGHWLGLFGGGGEYCGPDVNAPPDALSSHPVPGVIVPVDFKWGAHGLEGKFSIDHFLPGRCHWKFYSLDTLSPAKDPVSLYSEQTVNYNFDTSHSHGIYDQSATQSTDLWCGADPSPEGNEHGKMLCTSLDYFVVYPGVVANELLARVPVVQREHVALVKIFPFTTSITLRYHDLDAENRAASISSTSAHAGAPKPCPRDGVRIYVDEKGVTHVNGAPVAPEDLLQHLRRLDPAPKLACYSLASTAGLPLRRGIGAITDVGMLDLPIEVYADDSFTVPVHLK